MSYQARTRVTKGGEAREGEGGEDGWDGDLAASYYLWYGCGGGSGGECWWWCGAGGGGGGVRDGCEGLFSFFIISVEDAGSILYSSFPVWYRRRSISPAVVLVSS